MYQVNTKKEDLARRVEEKIAIKNTALRALSEEKQVLEVKLKTAFDEQMALRTELLKASKEKQTFEKELSTSFEARSNLETELTKSRHDIEAISKSNEIAQQRCAEAQEKLKITLETATNIMPEVSASESSSESSLALVVAHHARVSSLFKLRVVDLQNSKGLITLENTGNI